MSWTSAPLLWPPGWRRGQIVQLSQACQQGGAWCEQALLAGAGAGAVAEADRAAPRKQPPPCAPCSGLWLC